MGMVTDRDITVRGVAARMSPDTARVSEVMTDNLQFCTEDQDSAEVMRTMGEAQARRQVGHIDQAVREISAPSA